ncbi:MAG: hypothetical protein HY243_07415 [Proteobacteria bacterium]|nr:hypothetical protein [Pseudomonadota bacterium]
MRSTRFFVVVVAAVTLAVAAVAQTMDAPTDADAIAPLGPDHKVPHHGRPPQRVSFPKIRDWDSLVITLTRTGCFGACPDYTVSIQGDGSVNYNGLRFVGTTGEQHANIARRDVKALYARFKRANFFWLYGSYHAFVTDLPTYRLSISYDGHEKVVTDYAGRMIGMPQAVAQLEATVDNVARTDKWTKGWKPGQPTP